MSGFLEKRAAITGIGISEVGRRLERTGLQLTLDACLAAIADAGLRPQDVDGLASWPGTPERSPGMSPVGLMEVKESLGLELSWFTAGGEAPSQISSVINAAAVVAAGYARHVLCFRTVTEASSQTRERRASVSGAEGGRISGDLQYQAAFRAMSAAQWIAMFAQRHFHEFGTTKEQLGWVALNARRNAALNPRAIFRDPLTMDDYLNARVISTPFGLFDCDIPCDGSTAVLVSRVEEARDLRKPVLHIEAVGTAIHGRSSWDQFDDLTTMAARDSARMLWNRTDLTPGDVDVAELYDGFSFLTLAWLEALGFCGRGESGPFVEGGARIAREGELPLNTQGGQLSGGRLHGMGYLHEACCQLWGEAGERQVAGELKLAAVGVGGGPVSGCMLVRRD
jgi:acetyl-CoA acetyltransferase